MAIMVSAASASAADYQCTTSLDAGQDVHINPLWLAGIAILIIGGLIVCGIVLIPGTITAGSIAIFAGGMLVAGGAIGAGYQLGSSESDNILNSLFGSSSVDLPSPPGPTDVHAGSEQSGWSGSRDANTNPAGVPTMPNPSGPTEAQSGSEHSGWSGSRDSDTTTFGQSGPTPPQAGGDSPSAGDAGGTVPGDPASSGSNNPRSDGTTANAPVKSSDGLSLNELFESQGQSPGNPSPTSGSQVDTSDGLSVDELSRDSGIPTGPSSSTNSGGSSYHPDVQEVLDTLNRIGN